MRSTKGKERKSDGKIIYRFQRLRVLDKLSMAFSQ